MTESSGEKNQLRVFYSWQSDLPGSVCRNFIQDALERAAKDDGLPEILVDRDTKGVPGTPDIVDVIMEKIDACDVLVADISLVTPAEAKRPAPNPNVLFELGYAVKSIGWSRILLVMNEAFGSYERLPFDLGRTRRKPITYSLAEGQEKKDSRSGLVGTLTEALRTVAENAGRIEPVSPSGERPLQQELAKLQEGLESGAPLRVLLLRARKIATGLGMEYYESLFQKHLLCEHNMERFNPGKVRPEDIAYYEDRLVDRMPSHQHNAAAFWLAVPHAKFSSHDVDELEALASRPFQGMDAENVQRLFSIRQVAGRIRKRVVQFLLEAEKGAGQR